MKSIAVLVTVFNRKEKTRKCFESMWKDLETHPELTVDVWITDDGSSDGTRDMLMESFPGKPINVLDGDGSLFWNGGMINSWKAAMTHGGYDGYLWLNNDVVILPGLFDDLQAADEYSKQTFGKTGIYVASLQNLDRTKFAYGGFNFLSKISLKDEFVVPNGQFQTCMCTHGNITYVSNEVVESQGIFNEGYFHGGTDHDYSYLAYKAGFPLLVLRDYFGLCDNDHRSSEDSLAEMPLRKRLEKLRSPRGAFRNALLFQKRCFPWRYPFVFIMGYLKAFFPRASYSLYRMMRK